MARDILEMDVVFVGAGPASLTSALYLKRLVREHNEKAAKEGGKTINEPQIAILEKGANLGAHSLSGAVLDTRALQEFLPDWKSLPTPPPFESEVNSENLYFLTPKHKFPVLFAPPSMHNKGFQLITLGKFVKWLGSLAEAEKIEIFTGFPGAELLKDGDRITGVRTGDAGVDKDGQPKSNFQPGVDVMAKVVVLAEGTHGHLTKKLIQEKNLAQGRNANIYATGVKELWELKDDRFPAGHVVHTMGWPLKSYQFGGSFLYGLPNRRLALGFVTGLDFKDPFTDPHRLLQMFKTHPFVSHLLEDAKLEKYGAKTIPEGGYWAIPKLYGSGFLIIGDAANFVNGMRLKGLHLAMKSGMLAAETIFQALLAQKFDEEMLKGYADRIEKSWMKKELWKVRNFRQPYQKNMLRGFINTAFQILTGGRGLFSRYPSKEDHELMRKKEVFHAPKDPQPPMSCAGDKKLTFDKLTSVYYAGSRHEENQPCHLHVSDVSICSGKCAQEYGNPCQYFCPASVYEMVDDGKGGKKLQLNFSNCVHCKTCDIADPYAIITWVTPEGGGGPNYNLL